MTDSNDQTKAHCAKNKIYEATYLGENHNWKIEDYYNITSKVFNDLDQAGRVRALLEDQKTNKFECRTKEAVEILYSIQSRKE